MNPPSPCTGSSTAQATVEGSTSALNRCSSAAIASSVDTPRYGYGAGTRYTSGANGPKPALYGLTLLVIVIASSVRPWNAYSKTTTAGRPVAARAILTAFSTASAPELTSAERCSPAPHGESSARRRQTSTYGSYVPTIAHWWRYRSACSLMASTTAGWRWPTFWQPIPPAKSRYLRPSGSVIRAPSAWATTRSGVVTPGATYFARSAEIRPASVPSVTAMR